MFTGWLNPFNVAKPWTLQDRRAELTRTDAQRTSPDEQFSLVGLNPVFAEFVDRAFRMRGSVVTLYGLLCSAVVSVTLLYVVVTAWSLNARGLHSTTTLLTSVSMLAVFCAFMLRSIWKRGLGKDLFAYTYYPVRFDRSRQRVYVFRHNGRDGVLAIPFEEVHWFIGRGERMGFLSDLRGVVLDGDRIVHMFAVGQFFEADGEQRVRSLWSFISTYMDGGPDALAARGVVPGIDLSVRPSWRNCWRWKFLMLGETAARLRYVLAPLYYPILTLLTAWRWLAFKTSRTPRWPAGLFDETAISKAARWPEPTLVGERDSAL